MAGERERSRIEQGLDALSRLGMLGLLLAIPAAIAWGIRRLLRRGG